MANQIVWCDIPVLDLGRAIKFYSAVLGAPVKKEQFPEMAVGILLIGRVKSAAACTTGRMRSPPTGA